MSDLLNYLVQNEEGFRKARLPALYSDFRGLQTTNPDGYQANISAWRRALSTLTRSGLAPNGASTPNHTVLAADESLLRALESKQYGRPLALGTVIREATSARDLIPLQDFLKAKESIYYKSWGSIPWAIAAWGIRQLGLTGGFSGDDRMPGGKFVVMANVEAASKALAGRTAELSSRFERTFSKVQFVKEYKDEILKGQRLSETDMDVLLKFMSRDKGLLLYNGNTIKIKEAGAEDTAITSEDETISSLKELIEYLGHQTTVLNKKIEELTVTVKEAVTKKNRVAALAALKSKKMAESTLEKRFATLHQIEEVASKIEQAADNVQLVKVMSASTDVLASLNAQIGGADKVEDVVDRMREQMSQADEVSTILAESGSVVDEAEIDDELEALEQEEKRKEEEAERIRKEAEQKREAEAEKVRQEAERAKKEAEQQKEAEETARKFAELDAMKSTTDDLREHETTRDTKITNDETDAIADEASGELSRLLIEEKPEAQMAS